MPRWFALSAGRKKSPSKRTSTCTCCVFSVFALLSAGNASASEKLTASERAVLDGVDSGDGTDLANLPDKSISGDFLSRLLSGEVRGVKFRHNGVQLMNAVIDGSIDISGQDVHVPFNCEHCEFIDDVDFSDVHFFHNVSFRQSSFDQDINMDHAVAEADLDLRDVQFDGDVDFSALQVSGSLYASGAHVNSDGQQASFDHIKAGILADFTNMELNGPFTLEEADLNELRLGRDLLQCKANPANSVANSCNDLPTAPSIDLEGATVHREFAFLGQDVDSLVASGLAVEGRATLQGLVIDSSVDLRGARFQYLVLADDLSWPDHNHSSESRIQLDGITFSQIELQDHRNFDNATSQYFVASDKAYAKMIAAWPDNAGFSARAYQQLEKAFAEAGRSDLADLAFESLKDKERQSGHLSTQQKALSWALSLLIRYGREPYRALYFSIAILIFGWYVFRRKDFVEPRDQNQGEELFSPFWYSLDLFLPLSTLPDAGIWKPKQTDRFRCMYARVHSLLGWILVPIGLAVVTGLIPGK
ncbi:MAG TPA: pentapeptide repeat-containing protein [Candidatus Acidoferrum sp.]